MSREESDKLFIEELKKPNPDIDFSYWRDSDWAWLKRKLDSGDIDIDIYNRTLKYQSSASTARDTS